MRWRYGLAALAAANLLVVGCEGHKRGCCRPAAVNAPPAPCCAEPGLTAPVAPVVTPGLAPGAPAPGTAYYPFATPSCNLGSLP